MKRLIVLLGAVAFSSVVFAANIVTAGERGFWDSVNEKICAGSKVMIVRKVYARYYTEREYQWVVEMSRGDVILIQNRMLFVDDKLEIFVAHVLEGDVVRRLYPLRKESDNVRMNELAPKVLGLTPDELNECLK